MVDMQLTEAVSVALMLRCKVNGLGVKFIFPLWLICVNPPYGANLSGWGVFYMYIARLLFPLQEM